MIVGPSDRQIIAANCRRLGIPIPGIAAALSEGGGHPWSHGQRSIQGALGGATPPTWTTGKFGRCLDFVPYVGYDTGTKLIFQPAPGYLGNKFTHLYAVNPDVIGTFQGAYNIIEVGHYSTIAFIGGLFDNGSNHGNYGLLRYDGGSFGFYTLQDDPAPTAGTWTVNAYAFNNAGSIYGCRDGGKIKSVAAPSGITITWPAGYGVRIGSRYTEAGAGYDGKIACVALWDRALPPNVLQMLTANPGLIFNKQPLSLGIGTRTARLMHAGGA